jgi:hypothetical protein
MYDRTRPHETCQYQSLANLMIYAEAIVAMCQIRVHDSQYDFEATPKRQ